MGRAPIKPGKRLRYTVERAELARDAARMKRCGLTERKIAEQLDCSQAQAHILIHEGIDAYLREATQESGEWLNAIIAEHIKIAQEAWIQWERSKHDKERTTKKTVLENITETTEMTEGQCGDPKYLAVVQSSMDSIAKLRKLFVEEGSKPGKEAEEDVSGQVASMFASMLPPSVVGEHLPVAMSADKQAMSADRQAMSADKQAMLAGPPNDEVKNHDNS